MDFPKPLQFSYDAIRDVLTIEGVQYSGGLFREFGLGPLNRPLKIIKREDGLVTVQIFNGDGGFPVAVADQEPPKNETK
jgi:hypothetical protein